MDRDDNSVPHLYVHHDHHHYQQQQPLYQVDTVAAVSTDEQCRRRAIRYISYQTGVLILTSNMQSRHIAMPISSLRRF